MHQRRRSIYRSYADRLAGRPPSRSSRPCTPAPIPEVAGLGRTLRQWRIRTSVYVAIGGIVNGGTDVSVNGGVVHEQRRVTPKRNPELAQARGRPQPTRRSPRSRGTF